MGVKKDPVLELFIAAAEAEDIEKPMEQGVTLLVGGLLVSGYVISHKKYFESDPAVRVITNATRETLGIDFAAPKDGEKRNFIHLRDARMFVAGRGSIPTNQSVFWRGWLEAIDGFNFGTLGYE